MNKCPECARIRREIEALAESYPLAAELLKADSYPDHPDLEVVGLMTGRVRAGAGGAVATMVDSGTPTSGDSIIEIPMTIRDWNTLCSTLTWLTGTD